MQQKNSMKIIARTALALWCLGQTTAGTAAMLDLTDTPLFLTIKAIPNILFVVDDAGPMDWEVMTQDLLNEGRFASNQPDGTNVDSAGPVKHRDDNNDGQADCAFARNGQTFEGYIYGTKFPGNNYASGGGSNCNIADDQEWRFRNSDFNPLYFDPKRTYKPWVGVDNQGVPFADMPVTAAKDNPYDSNSPTIDLTKDNSKRSGGSDGFRYYTWTDQNGNGLFDNGEETEHLVKNADAVTQQNFANWFSYHRRREYVVKSAYGEVLASSPTNVRAGLVTFGNNAGSNTAIAQLNADATTGQKRALLDGLYKIRSSGNAAMRSTLWQVGKYLECDSGNGLFSSCPALSEANGGSCQQNFVLMMTDGFYTDSFSKAGNTDGPGAGNTAWDGGAYADNYSETLADIAMHYYERDLHPELSDDVPTTTGVDEAKHQHMVTYTIAFGVNGTLSSNPPNPKVAFSWPNPALGNREKIDDLRHAAYNGRGEFLNANKPEDLVTAIKAAINSIAKRTSSSASVALNTGSRNTDTRVYQARFLSSTWSGELLSFPIDNKGAIKAPAWNAGDELDTQHWDTGRVIITYDDDATVPTGLPFRWGSLSTAMQNLLHVNADGVNDSQGEARLEYLRGNRANEGAGKYYRTRQHVLGDLIDSDPFFVGAPSFPDTLGTDYAKFRTANSNRLPMLYVGSGDGMLHGFAAADGKEKLAYIPSVVFKNLSRLTDPGYTHRYFVDGSPTVGDAYGNFGSSRCGGSAACWRSVLVSGLRKGGQGVFALDVTAPATFNESNAANLSLWEFTDKDNPDLGYTFSQPSIVKMANGKWAAVFGNGYNNSDADGHASTSGHAVLYIVFLDGGLAGTWTLGTDYIKLDTGVGEPATPNGLAAPAPVDFNGNFDVEYIYAGDLRGNLWKFDVSDPDPSKWKAPVLLFTAKAPDGTPQPIVSRPEAGKHPTDSKGVLVYFGTGKYLEPSDNTTSIPTQTFYAIWDKQEASPTAIARSDLLQQTIVAVVSGQRITSNSPVDWTVHRGWYLDLPVAGERQVSDSVLRNNRIIFTTLIPNVAICQSGGTGWLMELDAFSGSRLVESPFDLNSDQQFDDKDLVEVTSNGTKQKVAISGLQSTQGILPSPTVLASGNTEIKYNSGSAGGIFVTTENPGDNASGRQAWRQLQ
jgi:type IV pilus assembly protein PilY1